MSFIPHNVPSWHQVNFKEDAASAEGTHALRGPHMFHVGGDDAAKVKLLLPCFQVFRGEKR